MAKVNLGKKPEIEVHVYLDITNPDNPKLIQPEFEVDLITDPSNLPENIIKLTSKWAKPDYALSNIIDLNSYLDKNFMGKIQRVYDPTQRTQAQIKVLLKSWNLNTLNEAYVLKFTDSLDMIGVKLLSDDTMRLIGSLEPPEIMITMFNKAFDKLYIEEKVSPALKKVMEEKAQKMNLSTSQAAVDQKK